MEVELILSRRLRHHGLTQLVVPRVAPSAIGRGDGLGHPADHRLQRDGGAWLGSEQAIVLGSEVWGQSDAVSVKQ